MCSLTEALDYENEDVIISGFIERYQVSKQEAEDIFTETKKWLWLASKKSEINDGKPLFIDSPLMIIDEMWHNFILHTSHYYRYCSEKFNKIIHHIPTPSNQKEAFKKAMKENSQKTLDTYAEQLDNQCDFIYDHLGSETLIKWYETFPEKYPLDRLKEIKRH